MPAAWRAGAGSGWGSLWHHAARRREHPRVSMACGHGHHLPRRPQRRAQRHGSAFLCRTRWQRPLSGGPDSRRGPGNGARRDLLWRKRHWRDGKLQSCSWHALQGTRKPVGWMCFTISMSFLRPTRNPTDALTFGSDGSLYWTDFVNSALRRMTPGGVPSSPSTVFTFPNTGCGGRECYPLGGRPWARPTEVAGQFYVLSHDYGPPPGGYGAVVRVDPSGAGHLVHAFSGGPDGGSPHLALTPGADGFCTG